jgi:hypothetical protein
MPIWNELECESIIKHLDIKTSINMKE